MRNIFAILVVLAMLNFYMQPVYAQCGLSGGGAKTETKGEVCNTTCPVMEAKVAKDTPYTTEYKGKTIGFCCQQCLDDFKASPEKYTAKIEGENCGIAKS